MKTLFLIDSHSLIYKAYYAIQRLTDSKGVSTNAVYGFLKMLLKIIDVYSPDSIAAVFDVGKKTFRTELYPDYKSTRPPTPPDLIPQFGKIKEVIAAMDIPIIQCENLEADDLIGSLAKKYSCEYSVKILTADKDMNQLISDNIKILNSQKGVSDILEIDAEKFFEKYEIRHTQFIDYLGLVGDTSDNIPGVKGIGPKTAVKLLTEYESIDGIYKNIDNIFPLSVKEKLIADKEKAYLSKQLASIKTDVEIDVKMKLFKKSNLQNLKGLLEELGFKSIIKEIFSSAAADNLPDKNQGNNIFSNNIEDNEKSEELKDYKLIQIEPDTSAHFISDIKLYKEIFVYPAILNNNSIIYFFINKNIYYFNSDNLELLKKFHSAAENNLNNIIGYDLKKIFKFFLKFNINFKIENLFDYKIIAGLLNKDEPSDKLLASYFNDEIKNIDSIEFEQIDLFEQKLTSSCERIIFEFFYYYIKLKDKMLKRLTETEQLKIYEEFEKPLISVVSLMENNGIKIDLPYLKKLEIEVNKIIETLENKIYAAIDEKINLNSPKQIADILYVKLKLNPSRKIKTGFSTDVETLEKIRFAHPAVDLILEYRKYTKVKNTYIFPFIEHSELDGKIHTTFNLTGTTTGRFSSINPNMQTLPASSEDELNIKKAFIVSNADNIFVGADYSQIELRIVAHYADDEFMINAFKNDFDIHTATAQKIFGAENTNSITPEMRRVAKTINFGLLYGMSAHSLGEDLGISHFQAKSFMDEYFKQFSSIKNFFDKLLEKAQADGYVTTLYGRKRFIHELNANNKNIQQSGFRMAMNMPIQGTAADILKIAMLRISKQLNNFEAKFLLTIHDELIFEIPLKNKYDFCAYLKNEMENIAELKVPLRVKIGTGLNLYEAK